MKAQKFWRALPIAALLFVYSCSKEEIHADNLLEDSLENIIPISSSARVIGYLPYYRFGQVNNISFCKITHLNISFANPDAEGNLILPSTTPSVALADVIRIARSQNPEIKILISLAGGALSQEQAANWTAFLGDATQRLVLTQKVLDFLLEHNLDGVDVDLEWDNITSGYSEFILALRTAVNVQSKLLTAAYPSEFRYQQLSDQALAALDFVNIMAYDYTGPWAPANKGPHSSLDHAEKGIAFWKKQNGIQALNLNLGVPFYGYEFKNNTTVVAKTYASIINNNTSHADQDQVGNTYYNGRPTIRAKTRLAATAVGGIMIWELGQDRFDDYSLLETIHKAYAEIEVTTSSCDP